MLKRLSNRLREIKPAEFRKMEFEATKVTSDLVGTFRDNFRTAIEAIDGLMEHPDYWNSIWCRQLYRLSHDLKGLGGTFNYGLITAVGESLCGLIKNDGLPDDRHLQRRMIAHVTALRAILQFDLKGDGGSEGERLVATLRMEKTKRQMH